MARPIVALLVVLAAGVVALPADAQWKWRDKSGHVQYSDLPPPAGTADQDIMARPSPTLHRAAPSMTAAPQLAAASAAASAAAPRNTADAELEAKRKKAEADTAAKTKADQEKNAALRADNCTRAKAQMTTLDSGIRLAQTNPKTGEREFLDDKQRADEARRTREVIAESCNR
ncbi:MAG TPA: DUF4124 domain-containing protein [Caldimonas sp.]